MTTPLQSATPSLVLASTSSIRLHLLRAAGLSVSARPSALDETIIKARISDAPTAAMVLAEAKAASCDDDRQSLILGADQILTCEERSFDKPTDRATAADHLRALRGRTHVLHTALVCRQAGQTVWRCLAQPSLTMRPFSNAFIDAYLDIEGDQLLSTVGAYRLEGPGLQLFDRIEGEHAAILGLPLLPLLTFLRSRELLLD